MFTKEEFFIVGLILPARHDVWRDEKADPTDDDEHARRKVAGDDVVRNFPVKCHHEPCHGIVPSQGHVVLLARWELLYHHGVVQNRPDAGLVRYELVYEHHLSVVVVERTNLNIIYQMAIAYKPIRFIFQDTLVNISIAAPGSLAHRL